MISKVGSYCWIRGVILLPSLEDAADARRKCPSLSRIGRRPFPSSTGTLCKAQEASRLRVAPQCQPLHWCTLLSRQVRRVWPTIRTSQFYQRMIPLLFLDFFTFDAIKQFQFSPRRKGPRRVGPKHFNWTIHFGF